MTADLAHFKTRAHLLHMDFCNWHMHSVTLRMDRVFDVQPDAFSGNIRRTLFSFESGGKRYFSVLVNGDPKLQSGQTITAILERPGDWQTVLGMRIHETGEVCAPGAAQHVWWLLRTAFFAAVIGMDLQYSHPKALAPVLAGHGLVAVFLVYNAFGNTKIRRALRPAVSQVR